MKLAARAIDYSYLDGDHVKRGTIDIPATSSLPDLPSFFLFAFFKSGSVLVNALVRDLLTECGVPLINLPGHLFGHGISIDTFQCNLDALFPPKGYCFAEFRDFPPWLIGSDVLRRTRKLVIARDPRDMLVSLYYSVKHSHWYPAVETSQFKAFNDRLRRDAEELSLDEFCITYACGYAMTFLRLRMMLHDQNALILRYEDFVYNKVGLGRDICRWCGINLPEERIKELTAPYDAIPKGDEPHAHIRQVHPGDHKRKLRPDTIAVLNASLANFLEAFSYAGAAWALGRNQQEEASRGARLAKVQLPRRGSHSPRHERDTMMENRDKILPEYEVLRRERDALHVQLNAVRASTSWRVTAPFRRFRSFLGNFSGTTDSP